MKEKYILEIQQKTPKLNKIIVPITKDRTTPAHINNTAKIVEIMTALPLKYLVLCIIHKIKDKECHETDPVKIYILFICPKKYMIIFFTFSTIHCF